MELRERLMEEIRQYPCIYDKQNRDYMDKGAKAHAWEEIAAKHGMSVLEADKKYKVMRSSYTRYLKKKRSTPPGMRPPPVPMGFANLDWLANHIDHKETATRFANTSSNGNGKDSFYADYVTDGDDVYHSSYDEIMREEESNVGTEMIELNSTHLTSHPPSGGLKTTHQNSTQNQDTSRSSDGIENHVVSHARDNLRSEMPPPPPLPPPSPHAPASCGGIEYSASMFNSAPNVHVSNVEGANGPKAVNMYYNKASGHEGKHETVFNLIPLESVQPSSVASSTSEYVGKRKRIDYEDEDELFCLSLIPTLKRLGPKNRTIAKMRFQQVLFDLEFASSE